MYLESFVYAIIILIVLFGFMFKNEIQFGKYTIIYEWSSNEKAFVYRIKRKCLFLIYTRVSRFDGYAMSYLKFKSVDEALEWITSEQTSF